MKALILGPLEQLLNSLTLALAAQRYPIAGRTKNLGIPDQSGRSLCER